MHYPFFGSLRYPLAESLLVSPAGSLLAEARVGRVAPPRDHFPCTRRGTANLMRVKSRENWERFGAMRSERRVGARAESLTRGGLCFRREVANVTEAVLRWAGLEAGSRLPAGSHFERSSLVSDFTLVSGAREETSEASVDICSRPYTCEVRFRRGG